MQILIDIPDFLYDQILKKHVGKEIIARVFQNGEILPKGHGRLIDADAFEKDNLELWECDFIHPKYCDTLADLVSDAPTVIEADKGNE